MVIKYEMETMEEIDWAEMWRKSLEESSWGQRAEKPEYWDERVDQFEGVIKQSNREAMIISRLEIEPDYKILDIGAGPGTTAIPLAKIVKGVTAVEPSMGMLAYSIVMKDIKTTLLKMNNAAKHCVYIFTGAGRKKTGSSFWATFHHGDNEEKLRAYLSENLVEEDGMLALKQKLKTAMIWWRKEYENNELKGGEKERCV